jgi:hypothetical protein
MLLCLLKDTYFTNLTDVKIPISLVLVEVKLVLNVSCGLTLFRGVVKQVGGFLLVSA